MGAAIHGPGVDEDYIQFWLEQGVEMDVFIACKLRKYDELDAFLDANPQPIRAKAKDAHNCDLIDLAPDRQMVDHLLSRGYPLSIHVAAAKGMIGDIDRLLAEDPELLEHEGREAATPLFSAIWNRQQEAALHLLDLGARYNLVNDGGFSVMFFACSWGCEKVVRALLDRGIDVNFVDRIHYGYSYLHVTFNWPFGGTETNLRIVRMLFDAGINPTIKSKQGQTAYELASEKELWEFAELIKELSGSTSQL